MSKRQNCRQWICGEAIWTVPVMTLLPWKGGDSVGGEHSEQSCRVICLPCICSSSFMGKEKGELDEVAGVT
jgi:hypothetical protein